MKKIIYFLAVVGLITVVACSDEDKLPKVNYTGCQVCEVDGVAPDYIPEDYEICVALHTYEIDTTLTTDTIDNPVQMTYETVYVDGADTNLPAIEYFQLFCNNDFDPTFGGDDEEPGNCVTCAAYTQNSIQVPAEQVCKGTNGHAYLGSQDTGIDYNDYLTVKELVTDCN